MIVRTINPSIAVTDSPSNDSPSNDSPSTIRLDDFLKLTGVVGTGGEAKVRIQGGEVRVNGEVETRRRKQLVLGDTVELMGEVFEVSADDQPE